MFRPAKIHHCRLFLPEDKAQELVMSLGEAGVCEVEEFRFERGPETTDSDATESTTEETEAMKLDRAKEDEILESTMDVKELNNIILKFRQIEDAIDPYKPIGKTDSMLKTMFYPDTVKKDFVELRNNSEIIGDVKEHIKAIEPKVMEKVNEIKEIESKMEENRMVSENLKLLPEIKTNVYEPTENIQTFIGITTPIIKDKIIKRLKDEAVVGAEDIDKKTTLIVVFSNKSTAPWAERVLHEEGFNEIKVPYHNKTPGEIGDDLSKEYLKSKDQKARAKAYLERIAKKFSHQLEVLDEELEICKERVKTLRMLMHSKTFVVLDAWVPHRDLNTFNKNVENVSNSFYYELEELDDAPTVYKNPGFSKAFELITSLYSAPKYKKFDPTISIAVTFTIFFGFMLTDFVYGTALLLLAMGLYRGIGKNDPGIRNFSTILILAGISTAIFGAAFGSYFGDFFQKLGFDIPLMLDPMKDVMLLIVITAGLGVCHLMLGLTIGFIEGLREGKRKEAMLNQGVWLAFLIGILSIIISTLGIPALMTVGFIFIGLSVVLQVVLSFIDGGPMISILSVFAFPSFMGDILSYTRIMALAEGTAGIALAVNFMTLMSIEMIPYIGWPMGICIFIGGHLFNMGMNGLGAFIHTMRLHFLEFFGKYYEGGGKIYKPFFAVRKLTTTKRG